MGTITASVDDETETMFRTAVAVSLGTGKGKLGRAITEAMRKWVDDNKELELRKEALKMLEKGYYKLPKNYTFRREEAYEDRINKIMRLTGQ